MAQLRALICEDDSSIRALARTVLTREGFFVDVAPDGAVGLEMLRGGCYDVLLLDLMMPGVDGYEVIRTVKEERPPTLKRVVVMTAASEAIKNSLPEPVCKLLPKPFNIDALVTAVRDCVEVCNGSAPAAESATGDAVSEETSGGGP
jgi:two-component system OmpR family response regulator